MKKIISLFLLIPILLCGCELQNISQVLFIASIGVEKEEDTYIGYFYLPLSSDVGKTENKENQGIGQYAKVEGKTLAEVFENIQFSTELEVNLRHASSMVIHKDLMNDDFLNELIAFVKKDAGIDYNFYLFVTEDKMEDIFQFENPNKESVIYSVLVSTLDSPSIYMAANPIHFVKFAREFYSNRCISFPLLIAEELWNIEQQEAKTIHCKDAAFYYDDQVTIVRDERSCYMKSNHIFYDDLKEQSFSLRNYHWKVAFKEQPIIKITSKYTVLSPSDILEQDIKKHIEETVLSFIHDYENQDILNLTYYSAIYGQKYTYENIHVEIKLTRY
ncbi:MAG TPA: hypothetical protein IAD46_01460 [Candidatus Pelethenecus faecipullorum]|uniref:Spore germination protein N-terminal domain-containing protein n=1 Tax=Candidatus Pelethenecus faecipullorum TaxID=2840900 RepID=A0A9D1GRK3_9MOLU|nr:hypothetical protein [Candidatus Pelethenecus faecipullorum]